MSITQREQTLPVMSGPGLICPICTRLLSTAEFKAHGPEPGHPEIHKILAQSQQHPGQESGFVSLKGSFPTLNKLHECYSLNNLMEAEGKLYYCYINHIWLINTLHSLLAEQNIQLKSIVKEQAGKRITIPQTIGNSTDPDNEIIRTCISLFV